MDKKPSEYRIVKTLSRIALTRVPALAQQAEKPIDVCLNSDFSQDERVLWQARAPLMVLADPVSAQRVPGTKGQRVHVDESKNYRMRELIQEDGLLHRYARDGGYLHARGQRLHKVQLLVCVTIYNESRRALERTLSGIQRNLQHFCKIGVSSEQIVVVVIQDGILRLSGVPQPESDYWTPFGLRNYDFNYKYQILNGTNAKQEEGRQFPCISYSRYIPSREGPLEQITLKAMISKASRNRELNWSLSRPPEPRMPFIHSQNN